MCVWWEREGVGALPAEKFDEREIERGGEREIGALPSEKFDDKYIVWVFHFKFKIIANHFLFKSNDSLGLHCFL